jgi:hypothetical protein
MRCLIAAKKAREEADKLTYEQRAEINLKRMKAKGLNDEQIKEAIKEADKNEIQTK